MKYKTCFEHGVKYKESCPVCDADKLFGEELMSRNKINNLQGNRKISATEYLFLNLPYYCKKVKIHSSIIEKSFINLGKEQTKN